MLNSAGYSETFVPVPYRLFGAHHGSTQPQIEDSKAQRAPEAQEFGIGIPGTCQDADTSKTKARAKALRCTKTAACKGS
jgi:hypothetical protein